MAPASFLGSTVVPGLDVDVVGELALRACVWESQYCLLGGGVDKGEMLSSPPLFLTIYSRLESWTLGHESGKTGCSSEERGLEPRLGSRVELALVVGVDGDLDPRA